MSTTSARQRTTPKSNNGNSNSGHVMDEGKAHALLQYENTEGHFSLARNFRLADLVTIMNGFCGSYSILSCAHFLATHDTYWLWAAHAFPLAGLIFDFLDGKVARWRKGSSMLGQELDSLADLISFGVSPALLAFTIGLRTPLDMLFLTTFICCGLARLARFNATAALLPKDVSGKARYFEGLPIPSSLMLVGTMAYWTLNGWIESGVPSVEETGLPLGTWDLGELTGFGVATETSGKEGWILHKVSLIFGVWAAAMVSKTLRVPKI